MALLDRKSREDDEEPPKTEPADKPIEDKPSVTFNLPRPQTAPIKVPASYDEFMLKLEAEIPGTSGTQPRRP